MSLTPLVLAATVSCCQPAAPQSDTGFLAEIAAAHTWDARAALSTNGYEFERETIMRSFDGSVADGVPWKDDARVFMEEFCKLLGGVPGAKSWQEFHDLSTALAARGCDDPFVLYVQALSKSYSDPGDEDDDRIRLTLNDFLSSSYPSHRKALAGIAYAERAGRPSAARQVYAVVDRHIGDMHHQHANFRKLSTLDRHYLMLKLYSRLRWNIPIESIRGILEETTEFADTRDPWLLATTTGICEYRLAWEARGGGFWRELDASQREGYTSHLAAAIDALLKAWELEPTIPYPAMVLHSIAVEDGNPGGISGREWFERAVRTAFHDREIYTSHLRGLQRRWGGSPEATRTFAIELAGARAFDTQVPSVFFDAVTQLGCEYRDFDRAWKDPDLMRLGDKVVQGYLSAEVSAIRLEHICGLAAAAAWRQERYSHAYEMLRRGRTMNVLSYTETWPARTSPTDVNSDSIAFGGPMGEQVRLAVEAVEGGRGDDLFASIVESLPSDDPDTRWAISHIHARAVLRERLASGEWYAPPMSYKTWRVLHGSWTLDHADPEPTTSVQSNMSDTRMIAKLAAPVGSRAEMEVTIDVPSLGRHNDARFGFIFDYGGEKYDEAWRSVQIRPNQATVTVASMFAKLGPVDLPPIGDRVVLRVAIWDGLAAVWIDDALVYRGEVPDVNWQGYGTEVGLAGWITQSDTASSEGFRIRTLDAPPDELRPLAPGFEDKADAEPQF